MHTNKQNDSTSHVQIAFYHGTDAKMTNTNSRSKHAREQK
jgi:hypothetical protein